MSYFYFPPPSGGGSTPGGTPGDTPAGSLLRAVIYDDLSSQVDGTKDVLQVTRHPSFRPGSLKVSIGGLTNRKLQHFFEESPSSGEVRFARKLTMADLPVIAQYVYELEAPEEGIEVELFDDLSSQVTSEGVELLTVKQGNYEAGSLFLSAGGLTNKKEAHFFEEDHASGLIRLIRPATLEDLPIVAQYRYVTGE